MKDIQYNEPLTSGKLKKALEHVPDDVAINVMTRDGKLTANIFVWFENLETRQFVELQGYKPYHEMTPEEKKKCGLE